MLSRLDSIWTKKESTYGTDPTPAATDAVSVTDFSVSVEGEELTREVINASLSPVAHVIGQKWVDMSFSVNVRGEGNLGVAPETSALLQACGYGETINGGVSVVYQPVSASFSSCTIWAHIDGLIFKIPGCRGNVEIVAEAGEFIKMNFTMKGRYVVPVDGVLAAGTYDSTIPPVCKLVSFTTGGYAAIVSAFSFSLNVEMPALKDLNSLGRVEITGRESAGSFSPEAVIEATHAFWAKWEAGTAEAMIMTVGSATNQIQLDIAAAHYKSIAIEDNDGRRRYEIPFLCAGSSGDDEVTITFK